MRIKNEGAEKRCRYRKGVIRPFYFLHLLSIFSAFAAPAAVPLTWQVDTTRVAPVTFDAYHGETLALEAVFKDASRPLDLTGKTANLYWQTNGMESVYWATNATVAATNHIAATFTGAMDPGASSVRGFLGIAGDNYRAAFVIRFRPSPGFEPATLPLPTRTLDFATTEVRNAPYWTKAESDARYSGGGGGGVSTNAVSGIITNHVTSGYLCTVAEARQMTNATLAAAVKYEADSAGNKTAVTIGSRSSGYRVGPYSVVNGNWCIATNKYAHAEGYCTIAIGHSSHAEGYFTTATNEYAHAEGFGTTASGEASHAEGFGTTASGLYAHAEGYGTTASKDSSHAEGRYTEATANASHAEGYMSNATNVTAFVWQGAEDIFTPHENYYDHGKGTFNLNPVGGLSGFWIGETNLSTHIGNLTYTKAAADARFAPTNVAVTVDNHTARIDALETNVGNANAMLQAALGGAQ